MLPCCINRLAKALTRPAAYLPALAELRAERYGR